MKYTVYIYIYISHSIIGSQYLLVNLHGEIKQFSWNGRKADSLKKGKNGI